MLETLGTVLLLALMAAFAVCAVLLNEGSDTRRRRRGTLEAPPPTATGALSAIDGAEVAPVAGDDRRLPVGDFLFGALFLRESEPLAFSDLADAAAGSGMSVAQVLTWIERAEEGGLIERVTDDEADQPAVRLTEQGMDIARNSRRQGKRRAGEPDRSDPARALSS